MLAPKTLLKIQQTPQRKATHTATTNKRQEQYINQQLDHDDVVSYHGTDKPSCGDTRPKVSWIVRKRTLCRCTLFVAERKEKKRKVRTIRCCGPMEIKTRGIIIAPHIIHVLLTLTYLLRYFVLFLYIFNNSTRRFMAGGFPPDMAVKKNKFIEEWNGKREITERSFVMDRAGAPILVFFLMVVPYGIYTWTRSEFINKGDRRYKNIL
jgi:hypothetical protein